MKILYIVFFIVLINSLFFNLSIPYANYFFPMNPDSLIVNFSGTVVYLIALFFGKRNKYQKAIYLTLFTIVMYMFFSGVYSYYAMSRYSDNHVKPFSLK
jgi:hypothetical protein